MNRLILALAFTPALFSTAALAQTVPDDVAKELWCGSAFVAAFSNPPPGVPSEQLALAQNYIDQGNKMVDEAGQKYLNAGFTEEQVTKVKTDLTADLTKIVTGKDESGKTVSEPPAAQPPYSFNDCLTLLQARLPADAASSSASQ